MQAQSSLSESQIQQFSIGFHFVILKEVLKTGKEHFEVLMLVNINITVLWDVTLKVGVLVPEFILSRWRQKVGTQHQYLSTKLHSTTQRHAPGDHNLRKTYCRMSAER
jgi:hypothetical protein